MRLADDVERSVWASTFTAYVDPGDGCDLRDDDARYAVQRADAAVEVLRKVRPGPTEDERVEARVVQAFDHYSSFGRHHEAAEHIRGAIEALLGRPLKGKP